MKRTDLYNTLRAALLVALMLATTLGARAQVAEFDKYADKKGVSYIYVSKTMLKMAASFGQAEMGNVKIGSVISKLNSVQVIKTGNTATGQQLRNDVQTTAKRGDYELIVQTDDNGERTRIYYREARSKKEVSVVVILTYDDSTCTVVALTGHFAQSDLQSLSGT